jgi:hypothetical protein
MPKSEIHTQGVLGILAIYNLKSYRSCIENSETKKEMKLCEKYRMLYERFEKDLYENN